VNVPGPSRWAATPAHVSDSPGGLAPGFRASGVACGLKPSGATDLALLHCDATGPVASAARFTRSGVLAAPVLLCQESCQLDGLRAVVANAGNANAATGPAGLHAAARTQQAAAEALGLVPAQVAVASTGVIGVPLDTECITGALPAAVAALSGDDEPFAQAIRTTDAWVKRAALDVELPSGRVRLSAQAKGAGMISPGFATLLCFVQTDAAMSAETAELLLGVCVKRTFERISVDGQLSTNDTVLLMAGGASGVHVAPESEDELRLGEALDALLRRLALLVVADGEGARRIARVVVSGGHEDAVQRTARTVANSPLVKSALHGGDPNWGRIAQAVGKALPGTAPLAFDVWIEDVKVCAAGTALAHDQRALAAAVSGPEVEYAVALPGAGHEAELFFSDLSHEYVTINAEYTT